MPPIWGTPRKKNSVCFPLRTKLNCGYTPSAHRHPPGIPESVWIGGIGAKARERNRGLWGLEPAGFQVQRLWRDSAAGREIAGGLQMSFLDCPKTRSSFGLWLLLEPNEKEPAKHRHPHEWLLLGDLFSHDHWGAGGRGSPFGCSGHPCPRLAIRALLEKAESLTQRETPLRSSAPPICRAHPTGWHHLHLDAGWQL